jgi:hypothetical protein
MVIITMVSQLWVYNYGYFVYHSESQTIVIKYILINNNSNNYQLFLCVT